MRWAVGGEIEAGAKSGWGRLWMALEVHRKCHWVGSN